MLELEHPDITWCLRTGYPSYKQPSEVRCDRCGDIIEEERYEDETYNVLCKDCLLDLHLTKNW